MNKYFITLCDGPYEQHRKIIAQTASDNGFIPISLTPEDLDDSFIDTVKNILTIKRGLGLCVWKPYIILKLMEQISLNDYIVYMDSADLVHPMIYQHIERSILDKHMILVPSPNYNLQKHFTKRDCFVMMDCDHEEYWNALQIEAGLIIAKKTETTIKILQEWLHFCKNENIITDIPNICGLENLPGFVTHRHDQSIMSNLAVKHNLLIEPAFLQFIRHNVV
jgi:hypothetical protein